MQLFHIFQIFSNFFFFLSSLVYPFFFFFRPSEKQEREQPSLSRVYKIAPHKRNLERTNSYYRSLLTGKARAERLSPNKRAMAIANPNMNEPENMSNFLTFRDVFNNIPAFNGKNIPLEQFARPCRYAAKLIPAESMTTFLSMLHLKLSGEAADVTETKTYVDMETLLKDLKDYFEKPFELSDLELELKTNVQNYNEPVKAYSARTRKIAKRIHDRLSEVYKTGAQQAYLANRINEVDKAVIKAYIRGLSDQIGNLLMHKSWQTVDEAIAAAESIELELLRRQEIHQGKKMDVKAQAKVRFASITDELDEIIEKKSNIKYCEVHGENRSHETSECFAIKRTREYVKDRRRTERSSDNPQNRNSRSRDRPNSSNNRNNWHDRRSYDNSRTRYYRSDSRDSRDNSRNRYSRNNSRDRFRNSSDSRGQQRGRFERDHSRNRNNSRDRSDSRNRSGSRDRGNSTQRSNSRDANSRDNSRDRGNRNSRKTDFDLSQIEEALQNILKKNPNSTSRNSATGGQN